MNSEQTKIEQKNEMPLSWRQRYLNSNLFLGLFMSSTPILNEFYKADGKGFKTWIVVFNTLFGFFFLFMYFDTAFMQNNRIFQLRKKIIEKRTNKFLDYTLSSILKLIGIGIVVAILGGLTFSFFGFLSSLSVTTLLIIIIFILLFK